MDVKKSYFIGVVRGAQCKQLVKMICLANSFIKTTTNSLIINITAGGLDPPISPVWLYFNDFVT